MTEMCQKMTQRTEKEGAKKRMEISDLIVFVVALGIAVAGGVVTIMEMLKGGKNE